MFNLFKKQPARILPAIFQVYDKGYGVDDTWVSNYLGDVPVLRNVKAKSHAMEIAKTIWEDADHVQQNMMKSNGARHWENKLQLDDYMRVYGEIKWDEEGYPILP